MSNQFRQLVEQHLYEMPELDDLTRAAKNIRMELKQKFPRVKFSVGSRRFSMGNAIDVSWTDGPTTKQVESEVIHKYKAGSFDGRDDSYTYRSDRNPEQGSAKYIHAKRDYSEAAIQAGIDAVAKKFHLTDGVPTPQEYRVNRFSGKNDFDWQQYVREYTQETEF